MESRGNKYVMNIINVRSSDFGNYSCQAENSIGKSKGHIELTGRCWEKFVILYGNPRDVFELHCFYYIRLQFPGRPAPAKFRSPTTSRSIDSYNLTWVIESTAHLEEVRLLYRKLEVMINILSRDMS